MAELTGDVALQLIVEGRCDKILDQVVVAIAARDKAVADERGVGVLCWRLTLPDLVVDEEDLTVDECIELERRTGLPWGGLKLGSGAFKSKLLLAFLFEKRQGLSLEDAEKKAAKMTRREVNAAVSLYAPDPFG